MKKVKLTTAELKKLKELRDQIARDTQQAAWRKLMRAKIEMLELQLKYDWRGDLRNEMLLDKFLVTLRPWANRWKHKKNGGKGWKDDC